MQAILLILSRSSCRYCQDKKMKCFALAIQALMTGILNRIGLARTFHEANSLAHLNEFFFASGIR